MINKQKEWEYNRRKDIDNWEWVSNEWGRNPRSVKVDGGKQKLRFGEYHDWAYAEVLPRKYPYVKYLVDDQDGRCPPKQKFSVWRPESRKAWTQGP